MIKVYIEFPNFIDNYKYIVNIGFHYLCKNNHVDIIKYLLTISSINFIASSSLCIRTNCDCGLTEIIKLLENQNINPNDNNGDTYD
jgi:hypothetical protein